MKLESVLAGTPGSFCVGRVDGSDVGGLHMVWGHGWGQSGSALLPLAESLARVAKSTVIDFPGFGNSPPPPTAWGTAEYSDSVAEWLRTEPGRPRIWVGHSFGARVGIQLAARHPELVDGMVLIAAAGLPRKRSFYEKLRLFLRRRFFKLAKLVLREGSHLDRLRAHFGSSDYQTAGSLRPILVRVVSEDLTDVAREVKCPVLLLYGDRDQDTPPEIGERLSSMISSSKLIVLRGFDHHTILTEGRHQALRHILTLRKAFRNDDNCLGCLRPLCSAP